MEDYDDVGPESILSAVAGGVAFVVIAVLAVTMQLWIPVVGRLPVPHGLFDLVLRLLP